MTTLVLGAAGFIGSAVARRMASLEYNRVIGLVRSDPRTGRIDGVRYVHGDVSSPSTLQVAMSKADAVICCVSYVGSDAQRCTQVNDRGIENVAHTAKDASVDRLIYVSTASVYGSGPFRNMPVDGAPLNPQSAASRSRAAGEQHIRDAGGLVIRPHLIYGPGDRWFIPGLTAVLSKLDAFVDQGSALLSTIHVDSLARGIALLAEGVEFRHGAVVHLNDPQPRTVIEIANRENNRSGWPLPTNSIDRTAALARAKQIGMNQRHVDLISLDHWFKN